MEAKLFLVFAGISAAVTIVAAIHPRQRSAEALLANFIIGTAGGWAAAVMFGRPGLQVYGLPLLWTTIGAMTAVAAEIAIVSIIPAANRRGWQNTVGRRLTRRTAPEQMEAPRSPKKAA